MHSERRVDQRINHSLPIAIYRGGMLEPVEMQEGSFRGLFLRMSAAPNLRELLKLHIELPTRELVAHAAVARVIEADARGLYGVGLRFFALVDRDRLDWESFISSLIHARRRAA